MGPLRKAGAAFRKFDDAYSGKIEKMYEGYADRVEASGRKLNPLETLGVTAGYALGGAVPSTRKFPGVENEVIKSVLPAISAVSKYGAPAAGITLAGKGLIDLTAAYGGKADQPQPMQLTMG